MKIAEIIFSEEAEKAYEDLNRKASKSKHDQTILHSINQKAEFIKENSHYGEPIAKNKIPQRYKDQYDITNLFWVQLSRYWRMLYTITKDEDEIKIIAFVLDVTDHEGYNKIMGYKKK